MTRTRVTISVLLLAGLVLILWSRTHRPASALPDGFVLDARTWRQAEGLLPEPILERYRSGDYRNAVIDLEQAGLVPLGPPPSFFDASARNAGRFALDAAGSIVESATGEDPGFIEGLPFPDVSADDEGAGTRIIWNYFHATWYRGNNHYLTELVMLGRSGVERRIVSDVTFRYLVGAPEARGIPNPEGLLQQTLAKVVAPADLAGTVSLTWRYRGAKPDAQWTYIPGLRRTRVVSPLNRSDGFVGSDISLDDGPFFDAKPESFTFRLIDRRDELIFVDPYGVRGDVETIPVRGGGWRVLWKEGARIGADDPAWRGVPWAPVSAALAVRPMWVIEARPRDPNYLYGRLELHLDAETYQGSWVLKYDRAGTLVGTYQVGQGVFVQQADGSYIPAGGIVVVVSENLIYDRATAVLFPPRSPENPADYRVPLDARAFSPDALVRYGR